MQPVSLRAVGADSVDEIVKVAVSATSKAVVVLKVINRYCFQDLSHLTWSWEVTSDRSVKPLYRGSFSLVDGGDGAVVALDPVIRIVADMEKTRPAKGNLYFLNVKGWLKSNTTWADAGHEIVLEQFRLQFNFSVPIARSLHRKPKQSPPHLEIAQDTSTIRVSRTVGGSAQSLAVVELASGSLVYYAPQGENVLVQGVVPSFTRAGTDNDKGGLELALEFLFPGLGADRILQLFRGRDDFSHWSRWKNAGLSQDAPPQTVCISSRASKSSDGMSVKVFVLCNVYSAARRSVLFKIATNYDVKHDGRIRLRTHIVPQPVLHQIPSLPRVGISFQVVASFVRLEYFGRGPGEVSIVNVCRLLGSAHLCSSSIELSRS